ncbi:hypothetical protein DSUL_30098 [Desulfovibrionales bacterium]
MVDNSDRSFEPAGIDINAFSFLKLLFIAVVHTLVDFVYCREP